MIQRARSVACAALLGTLVAACSPQPSTGPAPAPAASPTHAQATHSLELYRQLQQQQAWELAAPLGQEIVAKYPGSPAAREVAETLTDTSAKAKAIADRRRLERLWIYQSGKESGGDQHTASIYSSDPAVGERVRLILRRHSDWGQSVYLFGPGKGFDCRGTCTVQAHFDDQPQKLKAYLPPSGEPALFIRDDEAFIARLARTQKLTLEVRMKGGAARTLVYEVGGFDPAKFPPLERTHGR
jgi:hypothetical protein